MSWKLPSVFFSLVSRYCSNSMSKVQGDMMGRLKKFLSPRLFVDEAIISTN